MPIPAEMLSRSSVLEQFVVDGIYVKFRIGLLQFVDDFRGQISPSLRTNVVMKASEFQRIFRLTLVHSADKKDLIPVVHDMLGLLQDAMAALELDDEPELLRPDPPVHPVSQPPMPLFRLVRDPIIRTEKVTKKYRSTNFKLQPTSIDICPGQITAVLGRNASGKSTLLRIILGKLQADQGRVLYKGTDLARAGRERASLFGYVAQRPLPWRGRLRDNLEFYAAAYSIRGAANRERVDWILNRFDLIGREDNLWKELSGGYQLRFELAKALLHRPRILILDEPLANLDVVSQEEFLSDLRDIAQAPEPAAILITSQHVFEMEYFSDQILFMQEDDLPVVVSVQEINASRDQETFEIRIKMSEADLRANLASVKAKVTDHDGYHQIDCPLGTSLQEILSALKSTGAEITYLRNTGISTKSMMMRPDDRIVT